LKLSKRPADRPHREAEPRRLVITAASAAFGPSLLALLGSLNLNWPSHPPVLVYDIGLDEKTLRRLSDERVPVRTVPPFCPHWRKHYTWKLWCWNDAPADHVLWMDAGTAVLGPLDEVFDSVERLGYFAVPVYRELAELAHREACRGCGVTPAFREGRMALAGGLVGMDKSGPMGGLVAEALAVALEESCIASTETKFNTDQAIYSLLMHRHFGSVLTADGKVYLGYGSPRVTPCQKVWCHQRRMLPEDVEHFARHVSRPGAPHRPGMPVDGIGWYVRRPGRVLKKVLEKGPRKSARLALRFLAGELHLRRPNAARTRLGLRD
jgi:hypothetical protein